MTTPGSHELQTQLIALAHLLEYPGGDFEARVSAAPSSASFACFSTAMLALSPNEREELYTATFDVTPACVAYVSIHLFGEENFKRGEFMARLHERYSQAGFTTGGELPDHLSVLLRFAAETGEAECRELAEFCLLGPLGKMIAALTEGNPYRALLEAVREVLHAAYPGVKPAPSPLEQMQHHGAGCATISAGCGCGAALDQGARALARFDVSTDESVESDPEPMAVRESKRTEVRAPAQTARVALSTL
ncbi:MAG: molecular chaperone TorD family protein [Verrucomicrobia bacterium]|nr:molecular chaperone TorD family protein [Verrucomicrobiota bacterium]